MKILIYAFIYETEIYHQHQLRIKNFKIIEIFESFFYV